MKRPWYGYFQLGDDVLKIGARVIKTGIAVAITMFICKLLDLEPAFFGAVSAVINMQPSIFLSFRAAKDQILVHILGVLAGFCFGYFFWSDASFGRLDRYFAYPFVHQAGFA